MYLPSEYTKTNSQKLYENGTDSVLFLSKDTKKPLKTPNLQIQKENNKKLNEIRKQRLTMLPIMVTMLPILVTLKTMNRHMQQIDHQTGEVVEGFVAYVVQSVKTDFRKDGWQWLKRQ